MSTRLLRALAAVTALVLMSAACGDWDETCANLVQARVRSPDGRREAVIFRRDCGATTAFSSQVSVVSTGSRVEGRGNTFIARHEVPVAAVWRGSDRLEIRYRTDAELALRRSPPGVKASFVADPLRTQP